MGKKSIVGKAWKGYSGVLKGVGGIFGIGGGEEASDPMNEYSRFFETMAGQILPGRGDQLGRAGKIQESALRQQLFLAETLGPKFQQLQQKLIAASPVASAQQKLTLNSLNLLNENVGKGGLKLDKATDAALRENVRSALASRGSLFSGRGAVTEASNLIQGQLNVQGQRINNVLAALSGTQIPSQTGLANPAYNPAMGNPLSIVNPGAAASAFPDLAKISFQQQQAQQAQQGQLFGAIGGLAGFALGGPVGGAIGGSLLG